MNKVTPADPIMLSGMTDCLAIAVENAILEWGDTLESFFEKFENSGLADSFSNQEPFATTGCTGEELVAMINEKITGVAHKTKAKSDSLNYTKYYWVGYALSLFVAEKALTVKDVLAAIPPKEWLQMYSVYHEYGDELLLDKLSEIYEKRAMAK